MSKFNYRDTRAKCEIFYLRNPEFAKDPCAHPEPDVVVVKKFKVLSYKEAEDLVDEFNKNDLTHTYYWRHAHDRSDIGLWHEDGVCSFGLNDVDEWFVKRIVKHRIAFKNIKKEKPNPLDSLGIFVYNMKKKDVLKRVARIRRLSRCKFIRGLVKAWVSTCDWCDWWLKDFWVTKFKDIKWKREGLKYWKKNNHAIDEYWSLELHILGDLKWNLKKLIEDGYTINTEFVKDIILEDHKDDPNFDLEEFMKKFYTGSDFHDIEERAVKLQKETYKRIIHLVDLYTFYCYQTIDNDDAFTSSQRTDDMQPILMKGTYDMLDYLAMTKKSKEAWDELLDLVKKYGQQMGD